LWLRCSGDAFAGACAVQKLLKMKPRSKRLARLEKELTNSEAEKHLVETAAKQQAAPTDRATPFGKLTASLVPTRVH